jgi:hypothetical protein
LPDSWPAPIVRFTLGISDPGANPRTTTGRAPGGNL